MTWFRLMSIGLICCAAQGQTVESGFPDDTARRIRVALRDQFEIPPSADLRLESKGSLEGYKAVRVFSATVGIPFEKLLLITPDGTLAVESVVNIRATDSWQSDRELKLVSRMAEDDPPILGPSKALVNIVMYMDYQCVFCRAAAQALYRRIVEQHDDKLRIAFKHHPLASHDWSRVAARSAVCAYKQSSDAFWKVTMSIFEHQPEMELSSVAATIRAWVAAMPAVDLPVFDSCVASILPDQVILSDENGGYMVGVKATPTLWINGAKHVGVRDEADLFQLLDRLEKRSEPSAGSLRVH